MPSVAEAILASQRLRILMDGVVNHARKQRALLEAAQGEIGKMWGSVGEGEAMPLVMQAIQNATNSSNMTYESGRQGLELARGIEAKLTIL